MSTELLIKENIKKPKFDPSGSDKTSSDPQISNINLFSSFSLYFFSNTVSLFGLWIQKLELVGLLGKLQNLHFGQVL